MKILILSDNHFHKLSKIDTKAYDAIIHCGDFGGSNEWLTKNNVRYVAGNCDILGEKTFQGELFGRKILVSHGDAEGVKQSYDRLVHKALQEQVGACFFGHTHVPNVFVEEGVLFLNPGSYPKSYAVITEEEVIFYQKRKVKKFPFKW